MVSFDVVLLVALCSSDYVILKDHTQKCLNVLRHCNHTLRWITLHSTTQVQRQLIIVTAGFSRDAALELLLKTAQFESR